MSLGYAERLSYREDLGGQLGAPEVLDSSSDVQQKIRQFAEWVSSPRNENLRVLCKLHHFEVFARFLCQAGQSSELSSACAAVSQVQQAKRIVAFTGAGISTSCGIPDFRGPKGVWTLQREQKPLPKPKVSFTHAVPSLTHQVKQRCLTRAPFSPLTLQRLSTGS